MDELPQVDEHAILVDVPVTQAWDALLAELDGATSGRVATAYARAIRCRPALPSGSRPLRVGSTVPGFAVTSVVPEQALALAGRHAFSTYELTFRLRPDGDARTEIRVESRAAFFALHGRLYRLFVIGTGFHVVAVRRLLAAVRHRAERPGRQAT